MASASVPRYGQFVTEKYYFEHISRHVDYAFFVPGTYTEEVSYPLVVLLHGLRNSPHQVIRNRSLVQEIENRGYIFAIPSGHSNRNWYGGRFNFNRSADPRLLTTGTLGELDVLNVVGIMRRRFRVDEKRIYLMGHAMGGTGTLHLGANYPDVWAAIAPISPALPWHVQEQVIKRLLSTPVLMAMGDKESTVPIEPIRLWSDAMRGLGMSCQLKELSGFQLSVTGSIHQPSAFSQRVFADVFDFFEEHKRNTDAVSISNDLLDSVWRQMTGPCQPWTLNRLLFKMFDVFGSMFSSFSKLEFLLWSRFSSAFHRLWKRCGHEDYEENVTYKSEGDEWIRQLSMSPCY